jgi:hypothetical protein
LVSDASPAWDSKYPKPSRIRKTILSAVDLTIWFKVTYIIDSFSKRDTDKHGFFIDLDLFNHLKLGSK